MKTPKRVTFLIFPLLVLATAILVSVPLFHNGFFVSDDGNWMVIRLSAFFQSFRLGQFPVRFLGRLNHSYGYPVANFLYPGFLYIGSLIHILGASFVDSVKIIFAGSLLVGAGFTFIWLRKYFSRLPSTIGAIVFAAAPYIVFDIYNRGSVGEVLAIAWAAMGLYSIAAKKPWLFALSISLLIVSHNSLAVLFVGFYILYISVARLWKDFLLMFFLGIGMATFFWFPAVYERKYVVFDAITVANPADYFVTVKNAMLLGFSGIIATALSLSIRGDKKTKSFFLFSFAATLLCVLPVSGFIWSSQLLSHIIQFPYRVLSLSVFLGAWFVAYILENKKSTARYFLIALFVGLGIWNTIVSFRQIKYSNEQEGYFTTNEATTTVHDEYMPRWVVYKPINRANERIIFYKGRGTFKPKVINTQVIDTVVEADEDSVIQLNTVYYPGWGVTVDAIPVHIDYNNPFGVMRIAVPQGTHRLVAGFRETIWRFLADNVSLGFFIWYVAAVLFSHKKRDNKRA